MPLRRTGLVVVVLLAPILAATGGRRMGMQSPGLRAPSLTG